jgi:hypothetical protein
MEFPEPYHSLPIREWRNHMKTHPNSYATVCVRQWLRDRHKWTLICHGDAEYRTRCNRPESTPSEAADSLK